MPESPGHSKIVHFHDDKSWSTQIASITCDNCLIEEIPARWLLRNYSFFPLTGTVKELHTRRMSGRKGLSVEIPTGISYIFLAPTLLAQTWLLTKSVRGNSYFNRGIQYVEEPLKP